MKPEELRAIEKREAAELKDRQRAQADMLRKRQRITRRVMNLLAPLPRAEQHDALVAVAQHLMLVDGLADALDGGPKEPALPVAPAGEAERVSELTAAQLEAEDAAEAPAPLHEQQATTVDGGASRVQDVLARARRRQQ